MNARKSEMTNIEELHVPNLEMCHPYKTTHILTLIVYKRLQWARKPESRPKKILVSSQTRQFEEGRHLWLPKYQCTEIQNKYMILRSAVLLKSTTLWSIRVTKKISAKPKTGINQKRFKTRENHVRKLIVPWHLNFPPKCFSPYVHDILLDEQIRDLGEISLTHFRLWIYRPYLLYLDTFSEKDDEEPQNFISSLEIFT